MRRKVFITEGQARIIADARKNSVDWKNIFDFSSSDSYVPLGDEKYATLLLNKEYSSVLDNFSDPIESYPLDKVRNIYSKTLSRCIKEETDIRPQLEKICGNTIMKMFNIPSDDITITMELVDKIDPHYEFHVTPDTDEDYQYDSVSSMDEVDEEVQKRELINALVQGAAQKLCTRARRICLPDLFDLSENLPHLYSKLIKVNEYLLLMSNVDIEDKNHHQGGYVDVTLGDDIHKSKIEVKAITFPILLSETIRGVLELVASNGLPDDKEEAKRVINKADILKFNPWYMRYGKPMWNMVTLGRNIDTNIVPYFIRDVVSLPTESFISYMREILSNTKLGTRVTEDILNDAKNKYEYNGFEKDLDNKRSDSEDKAIVDEYFSPDELWDNTTDNQFVRSGYCLSESEKEGKKKEGKWLTDRKGHVIKNDEGEKVPRVCPKCGKEVGLYICGEPVYKCENGHYFGTMPFTLDRKKKKK